MILHQLVEHRGAAQTGAGPWTVTARCGLTAVRRLGEPLPESFTAWASRVTCLDCHLNLSTRVDNVALPE